MKKTMKNIRTERHKKVFYDIFAAFNKDAKFVSPRGQLVKEVENFSYILPPYVRFPSFVARKYNINYVKQETLWYLRGERFDTSICERAKLWKQMVDPDGSINSNYGQYIFGQTNQFDNIIKILRDDRDSRRASISILAKDHLLAKTNDVPCTYSLNFRIRFDKLNMSVHMRSQDAIYGMGNDAPAFSFVHEMLFNSLKVHYPTLILGDYHHCVDSFHVYERHFEMLDKILAGDDFELVDCPKIADAAEVQFLKTQIWQDSVEIPDNFEFSRWLRA